MNFKKKLKNDFKLLTLVKSSSISTLDQSIFKKTHLHITWSPWSRDVMKNKLFYHKDWELQAEWS